jgi:hypothetical protein
MYISYERLAADRKSRNVKTFDRSLNIIIHEMIYIHGKDRKTWPDERLLRLHLPIGSTESRIKLKVILLSMHESVLSDPDGAFCG